MTSDGVNRTKNGRRRRLRLRRAKYNTVSNRIMKKADGDDENPTKNFSGASSSSSSSSSSPENDVTALLREESLRESFVRRDAAAVVRSHGCVSLIGRRREMEDAVSVELAFAVREISGERYDFSGVYDGHGGAHVAGECRRRLHGVVKGRVEAAEGLVVDWGEVMGRSFEEMDAEVARAGNEGERTVGSTAVVAVVGREVVVVANCGDSRAVLSRGGVAVALSEDHKPNRPDELERIEAAGGRVINWNGHRILGVLATSRSIGDRYLKPFVSSEPEITVTERINSDEFLILASDGLWDVVSDEFACQVVRRCLKGRLRRRHDEAAGEDRGPAEAASHLLAQLAMARGSSDNVSIIVVELNKLPRKFS